MYRSFAQLREGWTKNLALLFPAPGRLAVLRVTEFLLIVGGVVGAIAGVIRGKPHSAVMPAILAIVVYSLFLFRIRKAHCSWDANVLALVGLPMFSYLLLRSRLSYKKGSVSWKGRSYGSSQLHPLPQKSGLMVKETALRPALTHRRK
jgi:hypothetical protein